MALPWLFEISIFVIFLICLDHAVKKNRGSLLLFLCLNSLILEELAYTMYHAVNYSRFQLYVVDIPLAIVLGWAVLLYSVMLFTDSFKAFKYKSKPLSDALLLVLFDFGIDPMAVKLGIWSWNLPKDFFGIPYDNFFAWLLYTFLVSFFVRRLWYADKSLKQLIKSTVLIHAVGIPIGFVWFTYTGSHQTVLFWSIMILSVILLFCKPRIQFAQAAN